MSYESRLKQKEDVTNHLERDSSYFRGKSYFGEEGRQNYLVFQLLYEYLKRVVVTVTNISTIYIHYWQSKGLSTEQVKPPNISTSNDLEPILQYNGVEMSLKLNGVLLRQNIVTYNHGPNVSIFIVYKLNPHTINKDFVLNDGLFGAVEITEKDKNNPNNYVYSGFGICFDSTGTFTRSNGSTAHNGIIFGVDGNLSSHSGNKAAKNSMVIGKGLIQKINKKTVYADRPLITNFTQTNKTFVLSIHYYEPFDKIFLNGKKQSDFRCLKSEIRPYKIA